jgi:hypothetical protein
MVVGKPPGHRRGKKTANRHHAPSCSLDSPPIPLMQCLPPQMQGPARQACLPCCLTIPPSGLPTLLLLPPVIQVREHPHAPVVPFAVAVSHSPSPLTHPHVSTVALSHPLPLAHPSLSTMLPSHIPRMHHLAHPCPPCCHTSVLASPSLSHHHTHPLAPSPLIPSHRPSPSLCHLTHSHISHTLTRPPLCHLTHPCAVLSTPLLHKRTTPRPPFHCTGTMPQLPSHPPHFPCYCIACLAWAASSTLTPLCCHMSMQAHPHHAIMLSHSHSHSPLPCECIFISHK